MEKNKIIEFAKIDTTGLATPTDPQEKPWLKSVSDIRDTLRNKHIDEAYSLCKTTDGFIYGIIYKVTNNREGYEQVLIFFKDGSICTGGPFIKNALDKLKKEYSKETPNTDNVNAIYDDLKSKHSEFKYFIASDKNSSKKNGFIHFTNKQEVFKVLQYPDQKEYSDCKMVFAYKEGNDAITTNDNEKQIKIEDVKKYWVVSLLDGVTLPNTQTRVYEGKEIKIRYSKKGCYDFEKVVYISGEEIHDEYEIKDDQIIFKSAEKASIHFDRKVKLHGYDSDATIKLDYKVISPDEENYIRVPDDENTHELTISKEGYKDFTQRIKTEEYIKVELVQKTKKEIFDYKGTKITIEGKESDVIKVKEEFLKGKTPSKEETSNEEIIKSLIPRIRNIDNILKKKEINQNDINKLKEKVNELKSKIKELTADGNNGGCPEDEDSDTKPEKGKRPKIGNILTILFLLIVIVVGGVFYLLQKNDQQTPTIEEAKIVQLPDSTIIIKNKEALKSLNENDNWLVKDSNLRGTLYDSLPSYFAKGEIDKIINSPYNKDTIKNPFFVKIVKSLNDLNQKTKQTMINNSKDGVVDLAKISKELENMN